MNLSITKNKIINMDNLKNNVLIAEFMGWVNITPTDPNFDIYELNTEGGKKMLDKHGFTYHKSWDSLIPAIDKALCIVNEDFTIDEFKTYEGFVNNQFNINYRSIDGIYKSLIELIKTIKHLGY